MSKQIPSQDLLSNTEWLDKVYNELLDTHNDAGSEPGWDMVWDKEYARRQESRRSQSQPEEGSPKID